MSPVFAILVSARRPSLGRASARRVARRIDLLRAAAGGDIFLAQANRALRIPRRAILRDGLTQGGAGLVVGEPVHLISALAQANRDDRTIAGHPTAVSGNVAGVLPCAR